MIRRLCAGTAFCLVAALLLVACGASDRPDGDGPTSGARAQGPPAPATAQNLRVGIDLALGAHVMLLARTTGAALGVRTSEFSAYGTALHTNDATVADAILPRSGRRAEDAVASALTQFDKAVLDAATAAYTRNASGEQQAKNTLSTTYVTQMRAALAPTTHASPAALTDALRQQVGDAEALVDAQAAGNWTTAYQTLSIAYAHQLAFGTSLARAIAHAASHTYPGNPIARATTLRDTLETQLQAQVYLLGMAESAAVAGRSAEQQAAAAAYASSTTEVANAIGAGSTALAGGVSGDLTQAQAAAVALALATAQHATSAATTQQQALTQTFSREYLVIAHSQLGVTQKQAAQLGAAWGKALARQAVAEGGKQGTPQLAAAAATAGAKLGRQLGTAIADRYGAAFPTT